MRKVTMPPASRIPLTDQVLDVLREQVTTGAWPVGSQIPSEDALVAELKVGRSTVREAVKVLVHGGMLEIRHAKGTFVRSDREGIDPFGRRLGLASSLELAELRRGLEMEACRLIGSARTERDLATLRDLANVRLEADTPHGSFVELDLRFHRALVAASHNTLLSDLFERVIESLGARGSGACQPSGAHEVHVQIVELIASRDEEGLRRAAMNHLDLFLRTFTNDKTDATVRRRGYARRRR
jgi:DNA-binding FadR family transcriptional regulator